MHMQSFFSRWRRVGIVVFLVVLGTSFQANAQGGPFAAQIENFWRVISTGGRTFTNISVTGGTITGVPGLGGNITGVSGSLLPPTTPISGTAVTPVSQIKFTPGTPENSTRVTNLFSYTLLPGTSTTSKYGLYSVLEVPNTNDTTMSGGLGAFRGLVDIYGPVTHQYTGSILGSQVNVGIHNAGGAANVFGTFTQALVDTAAGSVGQLRGTYTEVDNNITSGGNVITQYGIDSEIVQGGGSHTNTSYGVYTLSQGTGLIDVGYGFFNDAPQGGVTITTKWSFYNADTTGPARSLSNWRAPLFASEASSILSVSSNTIAPTNTVHHVGAGLIKTITVPAMCAPTCSVMLIPDAAFTYDATGNIVVPGGGGTATINRVMSMTWDGTKWYPSY